MFLGLQSGGWSFRTLSGSETETPHHHSIIKAMVPVWGPTGTVESYFMKSLRCWNSSHTSPSFPTISERSEIIWISWAAKLPKLAFLQSFANSRGVIRGSSVTPPSCAWWVGERQQEGCPCQLAALVPLLTAAGKWSFKETIGHLTSIEPSFTILPVK